MSPEESFLSWFTKNGGTISPSMTLHDFSDIQMGRGGIALEDIEEGHVLFTIPRSLLFCIPNSELPKLLKPDEWNKVNKGWVGLILCMMHDYINAQDSKWNGYWNILPTKFTTPMFWSDQEYKELKGTSVYEKIGREEAEESYREEILPLIKSRPDIFQNPQEYTVDLYHRMGSLILSRSFNVLPPEIDDDDEDEDNEGDEGGKESSSTEPSTTKGKTIDEQDDNEEENDQEGKDEDEDDEDEEEGEDVNTISMVPMADMLNAVSGGSNARLFYNPQTLEMKATAPIRKGEQVFNTYADPPNSDLLRRYGHIDPNNPFDNVEITGDILADVACVGSENVKMEKIEFCLDNEFDDSFTLQMPPPDSNTVALQPELVATLKVYLSSKIEFDAIKRKGKYPDFSPNKIRQTLVDILKKREELYETSISNDEELLKSSDISQNKRNAIQVRLKEKQILQKTRENLLERIKASGESAEDEKKKRIASRKERREEKKRRKGD